MNLFMNSAWQHAIQHCIILLAGIVVARIVQRLDIRSAAVPCVLIFYPAYFFTQSLGQSQTIADPAFIYFLFFYLFHTVCLYWLAKGCYRLLFLPDDQKYLCLLIVLMPSVLGLSVIQSSIIPAAESNKYVIMISFYEAVLASVLGVYLIHAHHGVAKGLRKVVLLPFVYVVVIGFLLSFFKTLPPFFVTNTVGKVSAATIPLAVVLTGMAFSKSVYLIDKSSYFQFLPGIFFCVLFKLLLSPLLAWGIAHLMNIEEAGMIRAIILSAGLPTGVFVTALAAMYARSEYHGMAAMAVILSTVLSFVTIPLWIMIVNLYYPV